VATWLTGQKALEIYAEIKELTNHFAEEEFQANGKKIDLHGDDDEIDYIKYKALDTICLKYHIEEEQLKHVLYVNYILPNQQ
jgi:flagellar biosynthesis regulator FlbT